MERKRNVGETGESIPLQLVSIFTGLDSTKQENMLFVYSKEIESKPGKLGTSCTGILSLTVSVLWFIPETMLVITN